MSDGNIENLTYRDRCCLSNSNPVLGARHFSTGKKCFLKKMLVMVRKANYYTICKEFQVLGSLHAHCFLWVVNACCFC